MPLSLWAYVGWMVLVAATGIGLLIWGIRRKQFDDIEEPKYTMLEDKEPQPWPGRERSGPDGENSKSVPAEKGGER